MQAFIAILATLAVLLVRFLLFAFGDSVLPAAGLSLLAFAILLLMDAALIGGIFLNNIGEAVVGTVLIVVGGVALWVTHGALTTKPSD